MPKKSLNSVIIKYPPSVNKLHKVLVNFTKSIKEVVPDLIKIILFGSYARYKPRYGSDVDLLFLVSKSNTVEFETVYTKLVELSLDFDWAPLIMEEDIFHKRLKESDHWIKTIYHEGREIWPNFSWDPES